MGIKLPWFRARMTVKEGQEKNSQLVGTYSYKFDSYFDSNTNSISNIPVNTAEEKHNKAKISTLKDKKLPDKNKSAEKTNSKANSNSVKNISGKDSSLEEHKTNKNSNVPEKNSTNANKGVVKKHKRTVVRDVEQYYASKIEEAKQNTCNAINNENNSVKTDKEKLLPEAGKISHQFKAESENLMYNESDSENQKNLQTDNENSILLRSNPSQHASNNETQKSLRERRIPDRVLEQLTIVIPDNSEEFEEDLPSPIFSVPDDLHAYDEFDS